MMEEFSDSPVKDLWRIFRIMSEFVEGFDELSKIGPAVSIFGSARTKPDHPHYKLAEETARQVGKAGFTVITGGGGGIMEAANKGAVKAGVTSVGLNIDLPLEQVPNAYQDLSMHFRYFFCRKVMFLKYAHGFIVLPGGWGTMDEFFESLTLIQTLKQASFPVILMGSDYWCGLLDWMKDKMIKEYGYVAKEELDLFTVVDHPEDAVQIIVDFREAQGQVGLDIPSGVKKSKG